MYVVISLLPDWKRDKDRGIRRAFHIGRVKTFEELDQLMEEYKVINCLISPQPEPHLVGEWIRGPHHGGAYQVIYSDDGLSKPEWDHRGHIVKVDRTYALNTAYEEIRAGNWWLPPDTREIDGGEFYAQLKAPTRVRDPSSGELRYRWTETGAQDHYRHAHAFDHIAGSRHGWTSSCSDRHAHGFDWIAACKRESMEEILP
jgi:hypothetical protein